MDYRDPSQMPLLPPPPPVPLTSPTPHPTLFYYPGLPPLTSKIPPAPQLLPPGLNGGPKRSTASVQPLPSPLHRSVDGELRSPSRSTYASLPSGSGGYPTTYPAGQLVSPRPERATKSPSPSHRRSSSHSLPANKSRRDEHVVSQASSTRSRSPPVVTIAPTLSLSGLHYQDSRKAYDRAMLCHTVPSSGGFSGGLSTGLAGLQGLPGGSVSSYSASALMGNSSTNGGDYRTPDFSHPMPSYTPYPQPRPDDLFYGGLRSSMQQSAAAAAAANAHFRPEELNTPRSTNSYHESLLSQLPSSRAPSTMLSQEDYLMAARNAGFNPYTMAPMDHSNMHPNMYSHPFASYRSLEEQLYLERYGLLRPSSSASAMPAYPPLGFPSYLNFRYPSPALLNSDLGLSMHNNGMDATLNRMKMEEEQRAKERIREEELAAVAKSQDNSVSNRPLATVPPRESNNGSGSSNSHRSPSHHDRKDRDRQREKEKRRSERENGESSSRKATVQLPNESSSGRGVKVHTVSPLYASYPLQVEPIRPEPEQINLSISPVPPPSDEAAKRAMEFSAGALEAMAILKQRSRTPPPPPEEIKVERAPAETALDLSETCIKIPEPPVVEERKVIEPEDSVRSLLDVRVERWKRKRGVNDPGDEEGDDDMEEEFNAGMEAAEPSLLSLTAEQCLKHFPIPAGVSEEQHNFLHMFGLVTPQKRSECELVKCIRRQNILREPTPPPIEADEEDSATRMLKQRTRLAASVKRSSNTQPQVKDPALHEFAAVLDLLPTNQQLIEDVEKCWNVIVADRMRRHFGKKLNMRKRLHNEAFRPLNFDKTPPIPDDRSIEPVILKPVAQPIHFPLRLPAPNGKSSSEVSMSVANLAKLELADVTNCSSEASKLTSEVAFWLRHLKPTMARTLTSSSASTTKETSSAPNLDTSKSSLNDEPSSPDCSDSETPMKWPGIDSVMVLYMAHQQELQLETKFLREHCERLHLQLAEGQATLSKLCLALSSSVEMQRRCKEEDGNALQSINELQSTLKLLQSP